MKNIGVGSGPAYIYSVCNNTGSCIRVYEHELGKEMGLTFMSLHQ